jgi:hypothetical protein
VRPTPSRGLGWIARRPASSALASVRGELLRETTESLDDFLRETAESEHVGTLKLSEEWTGTYD